MLIITSPILIAQSGYTLTVRTDHSEYYPGETVKISGNLKENGEGIVGAGVCIPELYTKEIYDIGEYLFPFFILHSLSSVTISMKMNSVYPYIVINVAIKPL